MKHDNRRRSDNNRFDHERLRFAIRASGLYTGLFARRIGLSDSEPLYDVLTGQAPLPPGAGPPHPRRYPQIDLEWLMTGIVGDAEPPAAGQSEVKICMRRSATAYSEKSSARRRSRWRIVCRHDSSQRAFSNAATTSPGTSGFT